ncbi:MAG: serine hydrolase [Bacteroidales bacterium]|nr:serine hydrolase [Bacteroidales bacterium]
MKTKRITVLMALIIMSLSGLNAQEFDSRGLTYLDPEAIWIDQMMKKLTFEQKIAQLMVVRVPLDMGDKQVKEFSDRINKYGVGGVCFFAGTAERQIAMTRRFQKDARVPLFVCVDGEWGLGMRLRDMYSFPRNAVFGQLTPDADSIVYRMGEEIGRQCREMGIHINFAPVVDINSNPNNPVIGTRSFGTDRERVSQLGIMYALGLQSQGVMAVAKHYPGHGDTDADSHLELPVINHSLEYIDTVDLYPFKRMIEAGVGGIMTAHLQVNAYDSTRPSSLSPVLVKGLLRNKLGFDGLIITDGLDMKGVTNSYGMGRAELEALLAGNDILLLPLDVPQAIEAIKSAAAKNDSVRALVDYHCRRVLAAKHRLVVSNLENDIRVPGNEHLAVCREIVNDLTLNIDHRIDTIIERAIGDTAMPGCQVVVMHKGRVILNRAYGHQTYDPQSPEVTPQTLYDVASLTKAMATTLAIMKLVDDDQVGLGDKLSKYLPYLKKTDKDDITIRQALSHQTSLKAFDNYWKKTSNRDSLLLLVAQSSLVEKPVYSDFNFMLLGDVVEKVTGQSLEQYVTEQFYTPMGLRRTTFRPLNHGIALTQIAPTEQDSSRGLIHGIVHDPNANAMGGVSGHAGLFSTAEEVAKLMQMLLNGGQLDGTRYIKEKTVETFTRRHFEKQGNRRALGFDKQLINPNRNGQAAFEATQASYGHTGFTGTMLWVDPEYDLVYVFLSNRVYHSAADNKLARLNVRTDVQSIIYNILKSK